MSMAMSLDDVDNQSRPAGVVQGGACGGLVTAQAPGAAVLDDPLPTLVRQIEVFEERYRRGEAGWTSDTRRFRGQIGTPRYMPPEVFMQQEYEPRRADMYCLGIVLFIMSIGLTPFDGPYPKDKRFQWIYLRGKLRELLAHWGFANNAQDPSRNLSEDLMALMQGLLSPPEQRLTLQQVVDSPWFRRMSLAARQAHRYPFLT